MMHTDVSTIRKWLRELDQAFERARSVGPVVVGLDKGECHNRVQQILANLPSDFDKAERVLRESDRLIGGAQTEAQMTIAQAQEEARRIIDQARREAEQVLERAHAEQQRMLSQTEVYQLAQTQAQEILESAREKAQQIRQGADEYAYEVLTQLEGALAKVMNTVQNGKVLLEDYLKQRVGTRR
jgi:F0F1-type ATP synthase membrane subunit b/b'